MYQFSADLRTLNINAGLRNNNGGWREIELKMGVASMELLM
jgi:hypothetical protein